MSTANGAKHATRREARHAGARSSRGALRSWGARQRGGELVRQPLLGEPRGGADRARDRGGVAAAVRDHMLSAATLSVPLRVDVGTGANWDEAH